ncbi:Ig-like domain-containing protein, partial [Thermoproteota archaeon]
MKSRGFIDVAVVIVFVFILGSIFFNQPNLGLASTPNTPTNPDPYDGVISIPIVDVILSWTGGGDPLDNITYDVHFGDNATYQPLVASNLLNLSHPLGQLEFDTDYYWHVNASDNLGNWTTGSVWTFETRVNYPPNTPNTPNPSNYATGIPLIDVVLSWLGGDPNPQDTVTYALFFGNETTQFLFDNNLTQPSYALPALNYTSDYYWYVNATDDYGESIQGPLWTFETEINNPPNTPSNPNPSDGATQVSLIGTMLSWLGGDPDSGNTVTYALFFGNDTHQALFDNNLAQTSYTLPELNHTSDYYWYINATDNYGESVQGPLWTFQTEINNLPNTPNHPNPPNGATDVSLIGTILSWLGGDPDPGDTVTYDVYFGNQTNPGLVLVNTTVTNYDPGDLNFNNNYYWRIESWDDRGGYTQGPEWNFASEVNNPPNTPNTPSPTDDATGVSIIGTILSWLGGDPDPGDTATYDLYFGNQTNPGLVEGNTTSLSYNPGTLNRNVTYFWRIESFDDRGGYTPGPEWNFLTEINNAPNTPVPSYPQDGATGMPIIDLILNWIGGDPDPGDIVAYDLYFGNQTNPSLLEGNITSTDYQLGGLNQNTTYYWNIDAKDNYGGSTQGTEWTFETETINTPPAAEDQAVATFIDTPANIILTATDEDPQQLQYEIVRQPYYGTLSGTPPDVIYTPDTGVEGKDSFTFKAFDGQHYSNVATVSIYIWRDTERLDSADGTHPTLSYSPDGDLRVFYNVGDTMINQMVVRRRLNSQSVFGSEIGIVSKGRTAAVHYDASGQLDLAVDTGDEVK